MLFGRRVEGWGRRLMDLSDFPLGELLLGQIQAHIYYLTRDILGRSSATCIQRYSALKCFDTISQLSHH